MVDVTLADRDRLARTPAHALALDCLLAGIEAAHPRALVEETIAVTDGTLSVRAVDGTRAEYDLDAYDRVVLVGGGNAAGTLAAALEDALGEHLDAGVVVTDAPVEARRIEMLRGDHPTPSERGREHTRRVLETAEAAGPNDLVIAGMTGGGSALLAAPVEDLSLVDLRIVTDRLLASGATIAEINAVRKHCSAIKGGGLARAAAPATVVALVVSDVVGDDLDVIASGPTVADPSTYADALDVLNRHDVTVPDAVRSHLQAGRDGDRPETPTADDPILGRVHAHVIGNGRTALRAARDVAADAGSRAAILAADVEGEARDAALTHVAVAAECRRAEGVADPPAVLCSGGETTVTLGPDPGAGGPNQEFATACSLALDEAGIVVGSVDTDGSDGATDAAGALVDAETLEATAAHDALDRNDVTPLLARADALVRTGPTGTNVNDLRVMVITEP